MKSKHPVGTCWLLLPLSDKTQAHSPGTPGAAPASLAHPWLQPPFPGPAKPGAGQHRALHQEIPNNFLCFFCVEKCLDAKSQFLRRMTYFSLARMIASDTMDLGKNKTQKTPHDKIKKNIIKKTPTNPNLMLFVTNFKAYQYYNFFQKLKFLKK